MSHSALNSVPQQGLQILTLAVTQVSVHDVQRPRRKLRIGRTEPGGAHSCACVRCIYAVAIEARLRQKNNSWTLLLDQTNHQWHVRKELSPLRDGILDALSPGHYADPVATQYNQLFVLFELRSIACDDARQRRLLGNEVDHPVWGCDSRQSRVEVVQVHILHSRVQTLYFKDGLRKVLIE